MKTIKRTMVLMAAACGLVATPAFAESTGAVKLSDAELDNITAGSATVVVSIINPGKAFVSHFNADFTNVHSVLGVGNLSPEENPLGITKNRMILIVNPAQTISKCVGPLCL